jgi:hypothetical protein
MVRGRGDADDRGCAAEGELLAVTGVGSVLRYHGNSDDAGVWAGRPPAIVLFFCRDVCGRRKKKYVSRLLLDTGDNLHDQQQ